MQDDLQDDEGRFEYEVLRFQQQAQEMAVKRNESEYVTLLKFKKEWAGPKKKTRREKLEMALKTVYKNLQKYY